MTDSENREVQDGLRKLLDSTARLEENVKNAIAKINDLDARFDRHESKYSTDQAAINLKLVTHEGEIKNFQTISTIAYTNRDRISELDRRLTTQELRITSLQTGWATVTGKVWAIVQAVAIAYITFKLGLPK